MTPAHIVAFVGAGVIGITIIGLLIRVVILDQRFMDAHRIRMADLEVTATIFRGPVRGDH